MKKLFTILFFIFFTGPAWADVPASVQTYTTWGDFDTVVNTFERVALMVSDSTYHGLFFGIITISLVFGIISVFGRGFLSGQENPLAWVRVFGTIVIGVIIYQTFIQKTSQIVVYDETLNLQKTVADVPDGLILLAGISNKIEKGLVDIIWTSSDPYSFKEAAGGSVFNILKSAYGKNVNLNGMPNGGEYIKPTLQRYIDDCLLYEMSRPGNTININDFNNTVNLENILALAQSNSISTVIYNDTFPSGLTATCTECWTEINNYLTALTPTSAPVERFYEETCGVAGLLNIAGQTGIDVDLTTANKTTAFISALLGTAVSKSQLVTQKLIADELWTAINNGDSTIVANRKTGVSMSGMANMANDWIPILKGLVFAIFIGLFPFIALLIPTPLFGRALSFMFGSFLFLTAWGICDALIHSFAMDKAVALFTEVSTSGLGLNSTLMFETESSKALAMFGAARWSSMMLAGVLSAMIARFGGYAMSQFTSQMSMAKMQGAEAEALVSSPDAKARKLNALEGSIPSQTLSNDHGFNEMAQIEMYNKGSRLKGDLGEIKELGHGNVETASDRKAFSQVVGTTGTEARATALGVSGAREVARTGAVEQKARAEALTIAGAENKGHSSGEFERRRASEDIMFLENYGDEFSKQHGLSRERETANSYHKQGIAEIMSNGELSDGTRDALTKINNGLYGHQMLQEAGQSNTFSNISADQAEIFNRMAKASRFEDFHANAGDKVTFSGAFDGASGDFKISNISADQMGQENRGQNYNHIQRRKEEIVDSEGAHSRMQTPAGKTVFETTHEGTRSDTGDLETVYDSRKNYFGGTNADKPVLSTLLYKASHEALSLMPNLTEEQVEMGALQSTASVIGVAREVPTVTQFTDPRAQVAAFGLGVAEGVSYLEIGKIMDSFKSTGKADEFISEEEGSGFLGSLKW